MLCGENAAAQPSYLFSHGLAGWLSTQEGLAAYNVATQHADQAERPMFHWAMRAQAIEWALQGSFRDVYENLLKLQLDKLYAFATAFKVKRGLPRVDEPGSYTRDHVYYTGLCKVQGFVERGGNIKDLYRGRLNIARLPDIEELPWLQQPKYLPLFLQ